MQIMNKGRISVLLSFIPIYNIRSRITDNFDEIIHCYIPINIHITRSGELGSCFFNGLCGTDRIMKMEGYRGQGVGYSL